MNSTHQSSRKLRGFTLVEMIVVVGIIGIIAAFVVPAATTVIRGSDLTRGSEALRSQLSAARQMASTRGHAIEVRFLEYADPEQPGENPADPTTYRFHAIQLMEVLQNGNTIQIGNMAQFPGTLMLDSGKFSSILDTSGTAESNQSAATLETPDPKFDPPLPRQSSTSTNGLGYKYIAFRFEPDGSTNLNKNGIWYVTLYTIAESLKMRAQNLPITSINYFTVQIDPSSGSLHTYRPSVATNGSI